ncbi:MAG: MOSC domain-containing protein [Pseudomonadota bacterium]
MTISQSHHSTLRDLTTQFAQHGKLESIYLRPARGVACVQTHEATALAGLGLQGDRTALAKSLNPAHQNGSKRQVTLIQAEHLAVIAQLLGKPVDAILLRRNLVVSGINLLAAKSLFRDQTMQLKIGEVVLEITGPCEPCSKMEIALGKGAYNAMRGHGGVTAKVIESGKLSLGDKVICRVAEPFLSPQNSLF